MNTPEQKKISDIVGRDWVGTAVQYLGEALGTRDDREAYIFFGAIEKAKSALREFQQVQNIVSPFTKDEAKLSQLFHTYLRKYDDSYNGTIMHKMHSEGLGQLAWKYIVQNFQNPYFGFHVQDNFDLNDKIMLWSFLAWSQGTKNHKLALDALNEWMKEE